MKHTPGPWKATKHNNRIEIKGGDEWLSMIAHIYKSGIVNGNYYEQPVEANARLIATAPELLEALEYLLSYAEPQLEMQNKPCIKAHAIIAKAKGEG